MSGGKVIAFGRFDPHKKQELERISASAALSLSVAETTQAANDLLNTTEPHIFLVNGDDTDTARFCLNVRSRKQSTLTPIISLTHEKQTDLSFADVFSWGGDDSVTVSESRGLLSRLRSLPRTIFSPNPPSRGLALIADPDRTRRVLRARVLRNAGFEVNFASTRKDAINAVASDIQLVVVDEELEGHLELVLGSAQATPSASHFLLTAPRNLSACSKSLQDLPNAAATDGFAPPENVVFLANEMSRGGASDKRASRRLLYGTSVWFRSEGRASGDCGYTYNVSAGGLYVRTLAPPQEDFIWLELTPPRADKRILLEAEVVWRRPFGPSENATVPPGFGARIVDATPKNRAAWLLGCNTFCDALGFSRAPKSRVNN